MDNTQNEAAEAVESPISGVQESTDTGDPSLASILQQARAADTDAETGQEETESSEDEAESEAQDGETPLPAPWEDDDASGTESAAPIPLPDSLDVEDAAQVEAILQSVPEEVRGHVGALAQMAREGSVARSYIEAMQDPATAQHALDTLREEVYALHGWGEPDAFEDAPSSEINTLKAELAAIRADINQSKQQAQMEVYAARVAPQIEREVQKLVPSFNVTSKMVMKAVDAYPQHKAEPQKAVEAYYAKSLLEHARRSPAPKKNPPAISKPGNATGEGRLTVQQILARARQ